MSASRGSGEKQTNSSTKNAAYEINDGFTAAFNEPNNNIENEKTTNEMALKSTVVTVLGNERATTEKPYRRLKATWLQRTNIVLVLLAFLLLVAFVVVLFLYIQELDESKVSQLPSNNVCFTDDCISRSAGKNIHIL